MPVSPTERIFQIPIFFATVYKYRILSCALMASAAQRLGGSTGERVVVGSGSTAGSVSQVTSSGVIQCRAPGVSVVSILGCAFAVIFLSSNFVVQFATGGVPKELAGVRDDDIDLARALRRSTNTARPTRKWRLRERYCCTQKSAAVKTRACTTPAIIIDESIVDEVDAVKTANVRHREDDKNHMRTKKFWFSDVQCSSSIIKFGGVNEQETKHDITG